MVKWYAQVTKQQAWNLNPTLTEKPWLFYFINLHDRFKSSVFIEETLLGEIILEILMKVSSIYACIHSYVCMIIKL